MQKTGLATLFSQIAVRLKFHIILGGKKDKSQINTQIFLYFKVVEY